MTAFVSLGELEDRYPAELIVLAADETTGERDDARIEASIADAGAEMRSILLARYSADELARLDGGSRDTMRVYAIDIALYRIAVAFSRSSERIEERYKSAIRRLEAIAAGKGALTFAGAGDSGGATVDPAASAGEVLFEAPERMFTRARMREL